MLRPHTVKQAFLHGLLQCPNMYQTVLKLLGTGTLALRSRLVVQTILVALDPRMVRARKCVCLADPRTVRVRSPHTSGMGVSVCWRPDYQRQ